MTGTQLPITDRELIRAQHQARDKNHPASAKSKSHGKQGPVCDLNVGDLVYLKNEKDKTTCRDKYIVVALRDPLCKIRKFTKSQFRSKTYDVSIVDCYPISSTVLGRSRHGPIRGLDLSSSESEYESDLNSGAVAPDDDPSRPGGPPSIDPDPPDHTVHPRPPANDTVTHPVPPAAIIHPPSPSHLDVGDMDGIQNNEHPAMKSSCQSACETITPSWMSSGE